MNNDNQNDDNPSHIAIKQVSSVNRKDELDKDKVAFGDTGDDSILGGDASGGDFGDDDKNDPDAGGVMDIDEARAAMGESNDGDGEHRSELSSEDLNLNAIDDVSTPRVDDEIELDKAA
jgi:hypothetical protein